MPRGKKNGSYGGAAGDPPGDPTSSELQNSIMEIDRQIALHQEILRGAALTVYAPLVEAALARIRDRAATRLIPSTAIPQRVTELSIGQTVTVTMSPPAAGVIVGRRENPETGKVELLLLVLGKGLVTADESEVTPGAPPAPPPSTLPVLAPEPLPPGPESVTSSPTGHSIHAGDLVVTSLGSGRVTREPLPGGTTFEVSVGDKVYHFTRADLKVVPPPAPPPLAPA